MKRFKSNLTYVFLGIGLIISICVVYETILEDIIPRSRQKFWSYESFNRRTERASFPESLPSSAHNLSYYIYEGYFSDACGYYASLSEEEYTSLKEDRTEYYQTAVDNGQGYCYEDGEKIGLSMSDMNEKRIDFLEQLVPADKMAEFYLLCEESYNNSELYNYQGILCKDETCEIIELSFYGPSGNNSTAGNSTTSQERTNSFNVWGIFEIVFIAVLRG